MLPIVGGLGAALAFTVSVLCSARSSRLVGAASTLAVAMTVGLLVSLPVALVTAPSPSVTPTALFFATTSGIANVVGLAVTYAAYRLGAVGVITTIASTEGAIAALLSVVGGEALAPGAGPVLGAVALGVVLAATGGGGETEEGVAIPRERSLRAAGLAVLAAGLFGIGLYTSGRTAGLLPVAWAILPPRLVGVAFVAIPLAALGRFRMTRRALPYAVGVGFAEVVGYVAYAIGARQGIAVTAVLSSMFAPLTTVSAYLFFQERLGRRQVLGIVLVVGGVTALGILQG